MHAPFFVSIKSKYCKVDVKIDCADPTLVALVRWAIYDLQSQIYFIVLFFCKMKLIKSQITNLKLQKNLNNQCIKSQTCLDNWGLKLGYCLLFVNCMTPTKIKIQIRCSFLLPINALPYRYWRSRFSFLINTTRPPNGSVAILRSMR